ncbi:PEP/pyruvate-binding domain-containing protein [Gordonia sp. NPDC003504]
MTKGPDFRRGNAVHLLGPWSEQSELAGRGGGKAGGLRLLSESGLQVPDWIVLGTDVFDLVVLETGLASGLHRLRTATELDDALVVAADVRDEIIHCALSADVSEVIRQAYSRVGGSAVAVRSSMAGEDGEYRSYAGQFDTFLNVCGESAVIDAVRGCWASAFSPRSIAYSHARGGGDAGGVAVILQHLVDADASGVVFTCNPITGSAQETVISAVYGLGEGLVSGAVDADTYIVDADGVIGDTAIGAKESRHRPDPDGGVQQEPVGITERARVVLTSAEIGELTSAAHHVADSVGSPQDIEWAISDGTLWYLQARPVTASAPATTDVGGHRGDGDVRDTVVREAIARGAVVRGAGEMLGDNEKRIWDNSNIIESFNGITSPLTFTTAADIYGRVYLGYAESLRVPPAQLAQVARWTPVMLGTFHSRVYYNLVHWYRMVGIAPGYPLNRKVLEAALGVAEPLDTAWAKTLRPYDFATPLHRVVGRAVTTVTYLRRLRDIDAIVADFLEEFYRVYDRFEELDLDSVSGAQAYAAYRDVDADLVRRWGPLMVLDAILLTLTGSMYLLTKVFLPKAPEWFLYAVLGPGADVESAEPARAMTDLARRAVADPAVRHLIETTAPARCRDALVAGGHTAFLAAVEDYLRRYGYRSLDELKLESPDLREDPSSVFVMVRSAMTQAQDSSVTRGAGSSSTPTAQEYLDEHLAGIRRRIYDRLRAKVSRCAAHRERLRFARTRAFGMVKRLIRVMARDLVERGVLENFEDVFDLTVHELRRCYDSGPPDDIADMVHARRAARLDDSALVAPERFVTVGAQFDDAELSEQGWVPLESIPPAPTGSVLVGTPSCAGVAEATAAVVTRPDDVRGGVLVAYRTDPGWVAALPSASALVIERGSPLTHVAIVARELGVPTVVQVRDVTARLRSGMRVRVDGTVGTVTVLESAPEDAADDAEPLREERHA